MFKLQIEDKYRYLKTKLGYRNDSNVKFRNVFTEYRASSRLFTNTKYDYKTGKWNIITSNHIPPPYV